MGKILNIQVKLALILLNYLNIGQEIIDEELLILVF